MGQRRGRLESGCLARPVKVDWLLFFESLLSRWVKLEGVLWGVACGLDDAKRDFRRHLQEASLSVERPIILARPLVALNFEPAPIHLPSVLEYQVTFNGSHSEAIDRGLDHALVVARLGDGALADVELIQRDAHVREGPCLFEGLRDTTSLLMRRRVLFPCDVRMELVEVLLEHDVDVVACPAHFKAAVKHVIVLAHASMRLRRLLQ